MGAKKIKGAPQLDVIIDFRYFGVSFPVKNCNTKHKFQTLFSSNLQIFVRRQTNHRRKRSNISVKIDKKTKANLRNQQRMMFKQRENPPLETSYTADIAEAKPR